MNELRVARLSTATVYRLFFFGLLFGCVPIFLLDQPLTGLKAILAGPFIGVIFALVGTAMFGSAAALGLWVRSTFGPLAIQYQAEDFDA